MTRGKHLWENESVSERVSKKSLGCLSISKTHVFRIFEFDLKSAQFFENVPMPVLTKTITGIDKIIN